MHISKPIPDSGVNYWKKLFKYCQSKFSETKAEYLERVGDVDEQGVTQEGVFRKNSKENGHFHSNCRRDRCHQRDE